MIISISSGKGGTGKTTVAVNLALSIDNVQLIDCDVEEPNSALFLNPVLGVQKQAFIPIPVINKEQCNYCGMCREVCEYNAIAVMSQTDTSKGNIMFFPNLCHGCGACAYLCPENAITETNREVGIIELGEKDNVQFVHGRLNIGEAMAPPVIRQVKHYINPTRTVIIDAPPGTSCPVITAVQGTDYCVLVTEPTPFGLNDLQLAVEAMRKLKIPFGVVINRCDLGDTKTENYCKDEQIPILMKIPFSEDIAKSYSRGEPMVNLFPDYIERFRQLYMNIKKERESAWKEKQMY